MVGAEASSKDGRISSLPGVDIEPGYKQKLVQWCSDGVFPPVDVDVSDPIETPSRSGKVCYVVSTGESDLAPHFLNARKGIYVRTNEFSARYEPQLADEAEIRHLLNRRELVRRRRSELIDRAQARFRTFVAKESGQVRETEGRKRTNLNLFIIPRFPAKRLCEEKFLLFHLQSSSVRWRSYGFPHPKEFISQHESAIALNPCLGTSVLEANIWGLLSYAMALEVEHGPQAAHGIHLHSFVGHMLVFVRHASQMLTTFLGYAGPLAIQVSLEGLRDVPWLYFPDNFPSSGPSSTIDDELSFSIQTATHELGQRPDGIVIDILKYVFFATNWAGAADADNKLEHFVRQGYDYNFWKPVPETLLI